MQLPQGLKIADLPVVQIRKLLRRGQEGDWGVRFVCETLEVPPVQAERLLLELEQRGYVTRAPGYEEPLWRNTVEGNRLALASAAKRISRETADRLVAELLDRVARVNADEHFLYRVKRIVAFGSFITTADSLGDVDLVVELEQKEPNAKRHSQLMDQQCDQATAGGRRFSSFVERLFWPYNETVRFLRARSRYLSFHREDDGVLASTQQKVLFELES